MSFGGGAADTLAPAIGALSGIPDGPSPLRVMGALLVIVLLMVVVLGFLRSLAQRGSAGSRSTAIRVVGRAALGRKGALLLVEVDGRRILVGSTPSSLTALSEWEDVDDDGFEPAVATDPSAPRFDSLLGRVLTKLRALEGVSS